MPSTTRFVEKETALRIARLTAHAYERLRLQHPRLRHSEVLQRIVAERQATLSLDCADTASQLAHLHELLLSRPRLNLGELAFRLLVMEADVSEADLDGDATPRLRETVDAEIKRTLGYIPSGSPMGSLRSWRRRIVLGSRTGYRRYLKSTFGVDTPLGYPKAPWENAVLRTRQEWESAAEQVYGLGLPAHFQPEKNWDSLAALHCILRRTHKTASILDAGTELYSVILPCLFLYGYTNLVGINLVFRQSFRLGPIRYDRGDVTRTTFRDNTFDGITCLSVIEHGVDLRAYFLEMGRILKPGGVLFTSTDYYASAIDTKGAIAYGVPIHIHTREEISAALDIAREAGLEPTGPLDLDCRDKAIRWEQFSLEYTFLVFTLQKR